MATREDFLAPLRSDPAFAGFSDDILLEASKNNPGFDPSWLPAAPARVAPISPVEAPTRTIGQMVADTGSAILGGAGNVLEGADTLAQLATRQTDFTPFQNVAQLPGRVAGFVAEAAAGRADTGFEAADESPVKISDLAQGLKSAALKNSMDERSRAVAEAEPILGYKWMGEVAQFFKSTALNPSLVLDMVAEQVPILLTGAVAGGAARALGATEKTAAAVAAGLASIQQGGDVAGGALSSITATLRDMPDAEAVKIPQIAALMADGSTLEAAKASLALTQATKAGLAGTLASIASTKLMGAPLEELLVKLSRPAAEVVAGAVGKAEAFSLGKAVTGALKTGAQEGFQEVGEEVPGQLFQNMAQLPVNPNIDLTQGLGASGAGAFLGGFVTGGGLNFASDFATSSSPEIVKQEKVAPKPEKAQAEFSFDVPPPVVGQTTFVAPADVWDNSVGGFVSAPFFGRTQAEADAKRDEAGLKPVAKMTPEEQAAYVALVREAQPVQAADATAKSAELVAKLRGLGLSNADITKLDAVSAVEVAKAADAAAAKVLADRELASAEYQQRLSANVQARVEMVKLLAAEGTRQEAAAALGQPALPGTEEAVLTTGAPVIGALGAVEPAPAGVPEGQTEMVFPKAVKIKGSGKAAAAIGAEQQKGLKQGEIASSEGVPPTAPEKQVADIKPGAVPVTSGDRLALFREQSAERAAAQGDTALAEQLRAQAEELRARSVVRMPVAPAPAKAPAARKVQVSAVPAPSSVTIKGYTPVQPPAGVYLVGGSYTSPVNLAPEKGDSTVQSATVAQFLKGEMIIIAPIVKNETGDWEVVTQLESRESFIGKAAKKAADDAKAEGKTRSGFSPRSIKAKLSDGAKANASPRQKEERIKAMNLLVDVGYDPLNKASIAEFEAASGYTRMDEGAQLTRAIGPGVYLSPGEAPSVAKVSERTRSAVPAAKTEVDRQLDKLTRDSKYLMIKSGMDSAFGLLELSTTDPDRFGKIAADIYSEAVQSDQVTVEDKVNLKAYRLARDSFKELVKSDKNEAVARAKQSLVVSLGRTVEADLARARRAQALEEAVDEPGLKGITGMKVPEKPIELKFRDLTPQETTELNSTKVQESIARDNKLAQQMTPYGVNVTISQLAGAHAATYANKLISLVADYTTLPSGTTFTSLLHEFGHFKWAEAPAYVQLALQRGAKELGKRLEGRTDIDRRVAKGSYAEYLAGNPNVPLTPEKWAEEVVVETAALNGVGRNVSVGLWQSAWREMKTALLNSAMWLENKMTGQVNERMAQTWLDNHIASVIGGDRLRWVGYLNNFNVRPSLGRFIAARQTPGREWLAQVYNGGTIEYAEIFGLSPESITAKMQAGFAQFKQSLIQSGVWDRAQNVADVNALFGETVADAGETDTRKLALSTAAQNELGKARATIAAANELRKPLYALLEAVKKNQVALTPEVRASAKARGEFVPEPITDIKQLAKMFGLPDPDAQSLAARNALKAFLQEEGINVDDVPSSVIDGTVKLTDLRQADVIDRAYTELDQAIGSMSSRAASKLAAARERSVNLVEDADRLNKKLAKFGRNPLDAAEHIKSLFDSLRKDMGELVANRKRLDRAADSVSDVEATLSSLYGAQELAADKAKMTDLLVEKALSPDTSFYPIMGELFQLEADGTIDLANDPATKIRDAIFARVASAPESALSSIVKQTKEDRLRGTAFLSALITYTKRNAMETDMLRAAILKGEGDLAAVTQLQTILRESNDAKLDEIRAGLAKKNTRLPSERLIQRVLNARDELNRTKAALATVDRDAAVLAAAKGTFDVLQGRLEEELGITGDYVHKQGAKYVEAKSAGMPVSELFGKDNIKELSTTGTARLTEADMRRIIANNGAWLAANKDKGLGIRYQQLLVQQKVMQKALFKGEPSEVLTGVLNTKLESLAKMLEGTGSAAGAQLAARLSSVAAASARYARADALLGDRWENAVDSLQKASGIKDYAEFMGTVHDPLGQFLNNVMDDFDGALARVEAALDPEMVARPGFKSALRELGTVITDNAKHQNLKQQELGVSTSLVQDPTKQVATPYDPEGKTKVTQMRRQIERGAVTYPMITAKSILEWVRGRDVMFSNNQDLGNPFSSDREIFEKLIGSKADTEKALNKFLGESGWDTFLEPLLVNELGYVPRPIGPDGAVTSMSPANAKVFAAGSNESLEAFIEKSYAHYAVQHRDAIAARDTEIAAAQRERDAGGVVEMPEPLTMESLEDYRSRMYKFVGGVWRELDVAHNSDKRTDVLSRMGATQNVGIDARAAGTWPMAWKRPQHFGSEDNRSTTRKMAVTAALGRNTQEAAALVGDMLQDVSAKLSELKAKVPGSANMEPDQIVAKLKGDDRAKYKALLSYESENWNQIILDVISNESSMLDDNKALMEAWAGQVTVMVSGLRNALKNPTSLLNFLTLEGEISGASLADMGGAYADAGKLFLGSLAQMGMYDTFKGDKYYNAVLKEGYGDAATGKRNKDAFIGQRGVRGNLGPTAHALRMARTFYSDARLGFSYGGRFPAVRLLNPFSFTQVLVTLAAQRRLVNVYDQITDRMITFYKQGGDVTKSLTAKDLGFESSNRFDNLVTKAQLSGGRDLQLIAQETMEARKSDPDYIHPDLVHLAARLAADKISVEGSISANNPIFSRGRLGKIGGTLVGWPIRQAYEWTNVFSDSRNKKSKEAWLRGAKLWALGALPAALLMSALLDEWDEITGKPKAKTDWATATNSEQFFRGVMDALVDTGVLGLVTDVPATVVNSTMALVNKGPLVSLDNRVVAISIMQKMLNYLQQAVAVGPQGMNSAYMAQRGLEASGLGTPMQNADALNKLTGGVLSEIPIIGNALESAQAQRVRTSANNVIRAAAADMKIELKTFSSAGRGAMSPSTPHVYDMVWAAYNDDQAGFDKAYAKAVDAEKADGKTPTSARDAVRESYAGRDPWSSVLKVKPTRMQIDEMYKRMGDRREYVDYALAQYDKFGAKIGVQSTKGTTRPGEATKKWAREYNERGKSGSWWFGN